MIFPIFKIICRIYEYYIICVYQISEKVILSQHNCSEKKVLMKHFVQKLMLIVVSLFCQYVWLYVRKV